MPILSVLFLSLVLKALFPFPGDNVTCLSFIDDFVLVINNVLLWENIAQLEAAFSCLDKVLALVGLCFEPNKTELMHFTPKCKTFDVAASLFTLIPFFLVYQWFP